MVVREKAHGNGGGVMVELKWPNGLVSGPAGRRHSFIDRKKSNLQTIVLSILQISGKKKVSDIHK